MLKWLLSLLRLWQIRRIDDRIATIRAVRFDTQKWRY